MDWRIFGRGGSGRGEDRTEFLSDGSGRVIGGYAREWEGEGEFWIVSKGDGGEGCLPVVGHEVFEVFEGNYLQLIRS